MKTQAQRGEATCPVKLTLKQQSWDFRILQGQVHMTNHSMILHGRFQIMNGYHMF